MMKRMRPTAPALARWMTAMVATIALMTTPAHAASPAPEPLSAFPQSLLSIRTVTGKVVNFQVWLADNPARQEQGLMFIRDMDAHAGMLFAFPTSQRLSMWMENTYLALDMVFIDGAGRINALVPNTIPQSLDIISPAVPALAVLELKGGTTNELGIHVGDTVVHRTFHNAK